MASAWRSIMGARGQGHVVALGVAWSAHITGAWWMRGPATSVADHVAVLVPATLLLACGTVIVVRTQVRIIGWLLVLPGAMLVWIAALEVISLRTVSRWPDLLFTLLTPASFLPIVLLVLLFPTGRFANAFMRAISAGAGAALVLRMAHDIRVWVDDALLLDPSRTFTVTVRVALAAAALGFAAQVVAYRRRSPVEQRQVKWFLLATLSLVVWAPALVLDLPGTAYRYVDAVSTSSFPIAILVAMTRHRLYDIDHILSRTVAYTLVLGSLGAVFVALVSVATALLPLQDEISVAATTLAVVGLFNPWRRRVVDVVDRRFNRSRYEIRQVIEDFGHWAQNETNVDDVRTRLDQVIGTTIAPRTVGLWVPPQGTLDELRTESPTT